ncbi:GGDEF domain-containing protein [Marinobacter sp. C2H3]|uniref:GGDEF domain-containing protein n=1 Tax=Marinobacter sp. C2H3 TaxID=3119003 RepID=UPI00300EEEEC
MNKTGLRTPDEELSQFRVRGEIPVPALINGLSLAAVPLLAFFAWRAMNQGAAPTSALLVAFAAGLGLNTLLYLGVRRQTLHRRVFIALIIGLFCYLSIRAVEDGSAIIWLFAYPPIIFYISQSRVGVFACAGGFAGVVVLFSPLGDWAFNTPYSTGFRLSMIAALAFEMVSCYVLDQSRRRSKLGLLKLAGEFEHAAKHDALTGLANRREAMARTDAEYQRYRRHHRPFSVLLLDIDLFKRINDEFGHQTGDRVIRGVAEVLNQQCRAVDTAARWGGEEFLVLLPETGEPEAAAMAERIRTALTAQVAADENPRLRVTASIGVGAIGADESVDRLLQRTDEALYRAKGAGRDTVRRATG